jgi:hypothetical protein
MKKKRLIIVSGFINSGKDTAANYLVSKHRFLKMSFASSLKSACSAIFGWDRALLEGTTVESRQWREQVDSWWATRLSIPHLTPRWVLQNIGTEVLRNNFADDIWIASLEKRILESKSSVVITDCRFPNETASMKKMGAISVRIMRGTYPEWYDLAKSNITEFKKQYPHIHSSEYSSVNFEYDYYIDNNSGLEDLHAQLREIIYRQ